MPFRKYLTSPTSDPAKLKAVASAYEQTLSELKLVDRDDPLTELVAKYVVEAADTGERDPLKLEQKALAALAAQEGGRDRGIYSKE